MKKFLLIALALSALILAACGGAPATPYVPAPVPADYAGKTNPLGPDAAAAGASVFKVNCESCHGAQGHGDGPAGAALDPKPRDLVVLGAMVQDDFLFWRINEGKEGTSMVPWKAVLTEEQIWQLVAFIRTLK